MLVNSSARRFKKADYISVKQLNNLKNLPNSSRRYVINFEIFALKLEVRTSGECPSDEYVIKISKIFRDDLTLDNLSRAQLMAMCRYMNLNTFGTDAYIDTWP